METYTYQCPGCGSALVFDTESQLLYCNACGQMYMPQDLQIPEEKLQQIGEAAKAEAFVEIYKDKNAPVTQEQPAEALDTMEVRIYQCGSCGAEIMTNDVEVAKMCAYCGQPTILFDRVSNEKRPAKIIPFRFDKKMAIEKARERFAQAKFLPTELQNISLDSVNAIYLPYYCYNATMDLDITVHTRANDRTIHTPKFGRMTRDILLDASEKFNDDVSKILNPFPVQDAVPFTESYLSGFYADRCDVSMNSRSWEAEGYLENLLQEKLIAEVPGAPSLEMRQQYDKIYQMAGPLSTIERKEYQLNSCEYYFCPVYFITFKVGAELVILLVNGSTGKVVGNVPIDQEAFDASQKRNIVVCSTIFGIVGALMFRFVPIWWAGMLFLILAGSLIVSGRRAKDTYEKMRTEMSSSSMFKLARNR